MTPYTENLKIAAYAATGGRKTLQIGNLIDRFGAPNVGIISCEHGLGTIRSLVNADYVREVDNLTELQDAYKWAQKTFPKADQWVCVDGGSRVMQWARDDIFARTKAAYEMTLEGTKPADLPSELRSCAIYLTKQGDVNSAAMWIDVGRRVERLLDSFVKLNASTYWTFWEEQTSLDQYSKGMPWKPDTPGNNSFIAMRGAFDFIFRLVNDQETCSAIFGANPRVSYYKCRDDWRAGIRVPPAIEKFNLADLIERLRGEGWAK